jgi:hypothetical protein
VIIAATQGRIWIPSRFTTFKDPQKRKEMLVMMSTVPHAYATTHDNRYNRKYTF